MMTPSDVEKEVERIQNIAYDDERAHSCEDSLYEAVLDAIANDGCSDVKACAENALKTKRINFARWGS